tara:strand:- start:13 stop:561 length:549 start_codon:yes stop_codon:yes gene_type:complete
MVKQLSYLKGKDDEFTLASGRKSSHFFDMKPLMMDPKGSILLAELIEIYLDELEPDFVGGLELGAVPLTAIVITGNASSKKGSKRKGFMVRKEPKGRGGRKTSNPPGIEGSSLANGGKIVVLEDVTTTGGSAINAVNMIKSNTNCEILGVLTILDREEGGEQAFNNAGIPFEALLKLSDIAG